MDFFKIKLALEMLVRKDIYLLQKSVNEKSITHKLAEYLQKLYYDWNVDCEFNKNLNSNKSIIGDDVRHLLSQMSDYLSKRINGWTISDNDIYTSEEIYDLLEQLKNEDKIRYDEELDIYIFLLTIRGVDKPMSIVPDIIVHQRGTTNNKIVIEAKKSTNLNKKARLYDLVKLAVLVSEPRYNYKQGFFIDIPDGANLARFLRFIIKKTNIPKVYKILSN